MTGRTILMVDDNKLFRLPVVARLRQSGYRTFEAGDGEAGLELAKQVRPDLVLLDLMMPRTNGVEFLEAFRMDPDLRGTPVVVITAATDDTLITLATELGVEGVLIKSKFSLDGLGSLVASLVGPPAAA